MIERILGADLSEFAKFHHVGIAVDDMDEAIEKLAERFGSGPVWRFTVDRLEPEMEGADSSGYGLDVGFCRLGSTLIELLRPFDGVSPYDEVLRRGGGVHHFGFLTSDLEAARSRLDSAGVSFAQADNSAEHISMRWVYLAAASTTVDPFGGLAIELIEASPALNEAFAAMHDAIGLGPAAKG